MHGPVQGLSADQGKEAEGLQVTSDADLGGGGSCQASSASESSDEDVRHSPDSEGRMPVKPVWGVGWGMGTVTGQH